MSPNLPCNNSISDTCRVLEFTEPIEGRALKGHVFKNLSLEIQENCELNCYLENDCSSYNLGPLVDGRYVCELSDSDDGQHPRDLESRHGFIYGATKVRLLYSPFTIKYQKWSDFVFKIQWRAPYRCHSTKSFDWFLTNYWYPFENFPLAFLWTSDSNWENFGRQICQLSERERGAWQLRLS